MANLKIPFKKTGNQLADKNFAAIQVAWKEREGKTKFTEFGGLAVKVRQLTGSDSVKGSVMSVSGSYDNNFILQNNEYDAVGVCLDSGVPSGGLVWLQITGICEVLLQDGQSATRGNVMISAPDNGRAMTIAVPSSNPVVGEHFKEIGHCLESKSAGTNVLAKAIIHFN